MLEAINAQQQVIAQLQTTPSQEANGSIGTNQLVTLKSLPIPVFSGNFVDCTSTMMKGLIANVRRGGKLSNNIEKDKLVQLAECHLQDRASNWNMRLKPNNERPSLLT